MAHFSNYLENIIIDHLLRNQAFTPPTAIYVALFTADTGLEANNPTAEVSGGAYARQQITLTAASGGASDNNADITFPEATASWGTVTHLAIVDHATNATWGTNVNVLMWGPLTASKTVSSGDTFKLPLGDVDVSND
jgi:hypothetical protein